MSAKRLEGIGLVAELPPEWANKEGIEMVILPDGRRLVCVHPELPPVLVDLESGKVEALYSL